jgi:hypothetical protein
VPRRPTDPTLDLRWLWTTLGITGGVLAVLLALAGPFAAIVIAKALRRRRRRRQDRPADAIAGGGTSTSMSRSTPVAAATGRHAFRDRTGARASAAGAGAHRRRSGVLRPPDGPDEAEEFWRIVEDERAALATSSGAGCVQPYR